MGKLIRNLFFISLFLSLSICGFASLKITNLSTATVYVAVGYFNGSVWYSQGWTPITTGNSAVLYQDALPYRYFYIYVFGRDLKGRKKDFCIDIKKSFFYTQFEDCPSASFTLIDTQNAQNYEIWLRDSQSGDDIEPVFKYNPADR